MEREVIVAQWWESIHFQSLHFRTTTVKIIIRLGKKKRVQGAV